MTKTSGRVLLWAPRVLGALTCLFLGLFALEVFNEEKTFVEALPAFAIHVAPAALLCGILAASWTREWIGGTVFTVLGLAYIGLARGRLDWVLVISGPLLAVGALFLFSWRQHSRFTDRTRIPSPSEHRPAKSSRADSSPWLQRNPHPFLPELQDRP